MTILFRGTRVGLSALTAAVLALGVAACGSSSSGGGTQSSSSSAAQSSAATSAAAATSSDGEQRGGHQQRGGDQRGGERRRRHRGAGHQPEARRDRDGAVRDDAEVGQERAHATSSASRCESMDKGTLADFNGIQLDATEKASTPYYVKAKITNLGPGKIATTDSDPAIQIEGVDKTGQTQQSVTFFGDFPKCDEKSAPNPMGVGSSFRNVPDLPGPRGHHEGRVHRDRELHRQAGDLVTVVGETGGRRLRWRRPPGLWGLRSLSGSPARSPPAAPATGDRASPPSHRRR